MKQMGNLLRVFTIATILLGQSGCAMVVGKAAVWGGKKVYHKIEDDRAANKQARNGQVAAQEGHEDAGH